MQEEEFWDIEEALLILKEQIQIANDLLFPIEWEDFQEKEKAVVEKESRLAKMRQRKKLAKIAGQQSNGAHDPEASISTGGGSGPNLSKKAANKNKKIL